MKTSLFLGTALAAMLATGMASAAKNNYHSEPLGENELDENGVKKDTGSALAPTADFTVDTEARTICGVVTFPAAPSGESAVTAMHFHEGDDKTNGPVLIGLPVPTAATNKIHLKNVPADVIQKITDDPIYLNLHTDAFKAGAVRDQLLENNEGDEVACEGEGTDVGEEADGGASSSSSSGNASSSSSSGSVGSGSDAGASGSSATPDATDDGGCNTSGGQTGSGLAIAMGLGLVLTAMTRKRKKA